MIDFDREPLDAGVEPVNTEAEAAAHAEALVAKEKAQIAAARRRFWEETGAVIPDEMVAEMLAAKATSINARTLLPSFGRRSKV